MDDLRKAAEMALEVLEFSLQADELPVGGKWDLMTKEAIEALRQALAQPSPKQKEKRNE